MWAPMTKTIHVFISYKRNPDKTTPAQVIDLQQRLDREYGYDVFLDKTGLEPGGKWAAEIYAHIWRADVLLVILNANTHQSDWVQREVDVARGAHVAILPLAMAPPDVIQEALNRLTLEDIQYFPDFSTTLANMDELDKQIRSLSKVTRNAQEAWVEELEKVRRVKCADPNLTHRRFRLPGGLAAVDIYLATGDMTKHKNIDVIVNTENDYMQMARMFESSTLSSRLRVAGAKMTLRGLEDDTVQQALDEQVAAYGRPIMAASVIPTQAGHPESELARNGVRFIFHAATVHVRETELQAVDLGTIRKAVDNCLKMVLSVNKRRGVISPAGTDRNRQEQACQAAYRPIKSIIFPLFGAGQGGLAANQVAPQMAEGFRSFLLENVQEPQMTLESIHLCVHSVTDVAVVEQALAAVFQPAD